jgi:hypothetical protein
MDFMKKNAKPLIALGVVVVLILIVWLGIAQYRRSVNNEGYGLQRDVVTAEQQMEISLSKCLDTGRTAAQVATQEFQQIKDVLTSIVSARYVDANGNSTVAAGTLGGGSFVSALSEQYPQIDTSTWKKLMDVVVGCRQDFADKQDQLQTLASNFDKWTQQGNVFSHGIHTQYPDKRLKAYNALEHKEVYSRRALDYLTRVIKTADTQKAIDSGTMPDQGLFPSTAASPTK